MLRRRCAGTAAQDHLPAHELAVVLAQRSLKRPKAGISQVSAPRPLPAIAEELRSALSLSGHGSQCAGIKQVAFDRCALHRRLPFELGGQATTSPANVRVSL